MFRKGLERIARLQLLSPEHALHVHRALSLHVLSANLMAHCKRDLAFDGGGTIETSP